MCFVATKAEEMILDGAIRWMAHATTDDTRALGAKLQARLTPAQQAKIKQVLHDVQTAIGAGCGV